MINSTTSGHCCKSIDRTLAALLLLQKYYTYKIYIFKKIPDVYHVQDLNKMRLIVINNHNSEDSGQPDEYYQCVTEESGGNGEIS
jgi:hypothetical protein